MFGNKQPNWTPCARVIWQWGSVMGALSHLRIVEIGSAAASYCARLFADFGATVHKIEPPHGDPLRRTAPLTPKGQSAWFAFLNFNKSSVALDPTDATRLTERIGNCDS
ncbi:CoA transferase [Bradyrhizobium sediminis]|uniref:CoA transferase n=1 Tax=Bradyrhizobium sediminis TaxID=2840469 RepID=UPI00201C9FEE|nr:CoA transferase [Bradyrhizobium sediminis]